MKRDKRENREQDEPSRTMLSTAAPEKLLRVVERCQWEKKNLEGEGDLRKWCFGV